MDAENLLREQLHDVQDNLRRGFHAFQRDELHLAVEVQAAGEDVRAGEALDLAGKPAISIAFTAFSTTK